MTETYTSGTWIVKPGEEDDFVAAWREFVTWAAELDGHGTFRLVRDLDNPAVTVCRGTFRRSPTIPPSI